MSPFWCAAKYYQQQLSIVFPFFTPINCCCCFWKWWQKFSFRLIMFLKRVGNCMLKQLFFFQFQSPTHVIIQEVSSNSAVRSKLWYQRKLCLPGHFDQIMDLKFCMVLVSQKTKSKIKIKQSNQGKRMNKFCLFCILLLTLQNRIIGGLQGMKQVIYFFSSSTQLILSTLLVAANDL